MSGLYDSSPEKRGDRLSAEARRAIAEFDGPVTRVPGGESGLPEVGTRTRGEIREAGYRVSARQRRFADAGRVDAPARVDPAKPAPRASAGDATKPENRGGLSTAASVLGGLATLPAITVDNSRARAVPAWETVCAFEWVATADLRIAESYQRGLSRDGRRRVGGIALGFDWTRFGVLILRRAGAVYEVLDGQHRAAAALARGLGRVPALIVEAKAAAVFLGLNRDRLGLDAAQLFHAEVVAGEPEAARLKAILDGLEIEVPRRAPQRGLGPMQVRAVAALRRELCARGGAVLEAALGVIADAWADQPQAFGIEAVRGICRAVGEVMAAVDLSRPVEDEIDAMAATLRRMTPAGLRSEAKRAAADLGGSASAHWARLLCNAHAEQGGADIAIGV